MLFDAEVNEPHEGLRKNESQWPIHQINWQKSRYVYDMYYTYNRIPRAVYDYCITNKLVDAALIAKWKKPGYERLCSTYVINPRNYKFGTTSICRVPAHCLPAGTVIEDPTTGCRGCASGDRGNIFGNKYGQYLAAIQIAREERMAARRAEQEAKARAEQEEEEDDDADDDDGDDDGDDDDDDDSNEKDSDGGDGNGQGSNGNDAAAGDDPVAYADGRGAAKSRAAVAAAAAAVWAANAQEEEIAQPEELIGEAASAPSAAAAKAAAAAAAASAAADQRGGPPGKKRRHN